MKKGKYRFIVKVSTEVLLTITDEKQFQADFTAWANLLGADRADEVSELDFLRSRAQKLNEIICCASVEKDIQNNHLHIEDLRTCRHCGCTEQAACELPDGPCSWAAEDVCTNPACLAAE